MVDTSISKVPKMMAFISETMGLWAIILGTLEVQVYHVGVDAALQRVYGPGTTLELPLDMVYGPKSYGSSGPQGGEMALDFEMMGPDVFTHILRYHTTTVILCHIMGPKVTTYSCAYKLTST